MRILSALTVLFCFLGAFDVAIAASSKAVVSASAGSAVMAPKKVTKRQPKKSSSSTKSVGSSKSSSSSGPETQKFAVEILSNGQDFYITHMIGGSPAHKVGLLPGDIIQEIDGIEVDKRFSANDLSAKLSTIPAGKKLVVKAFRMSKGSKTYTLVGEAPASAASASASKTEQMNSDITIEVKSGICVIKVRDFGDKFSSTFGKDLEKRLKECSKGVMIDFRESPGGTRDAFVGFASLFLPGNTTLGVIQTSAAISPEILTISTKGGQIVPSSTKLVVVLSTPASDAPLMFAYSAAKARNAILIEDSATFAVSAQRTFVTGGHVYIRLKTGGYTDLRLLLSEQLTAEDLVKAKVSSKAENDTAFEKAVELLK